MWLLIACTIEAKDDANIYGFNRDLKRLAKNEG